MNNSNDTIKTGFSPIDVVTGGLKPSDNTERNIFNE